MKGFGLWFAAYVAAIAVVAGLSDLEPLKLLTSIIPFLLEVVKHTILLSYTRKTHKTIDTSKLLAIEGAKFALVVAAMFVLISPIDKVNAPYAIAYSLSFIISLMIGAYAHNKIQDIENE